MYLYNILRTPCSCIHWRCFCKAFVFGLVGMLAVCEIFVTQTGKCHPLEARTKVYISTPRSVMAQRSASSVTMVSAALFYLLNDAFRCTDWSTKRLVSERITNCKYWKETVVSKIGGFNIFTVLHH